MYKKRSIYLNTFILISVGLLCRILGFFYHIFLSQKFGEEGVGLYHLVFPLYAFCISVCSFGMQTALSRMIAKYHALKNPRMMLRSLFISLLITTLVSLLLIYMTHSNSSFIAVELLGDLRCAPMIQYMTFAFPFTAIHSCFVAYYYGLKETSVPAFSQIIEQIIRIGSVFILFHCIEQQGQTPSIVITIAGLVISEIVSSLFCMFVYSHSTTPTAKSFKAFDVITPFSEFQLCITELLTFSIPVMLNRILITLLQGIEVISIPKQLICFGCDATEALRTYGVLSGMALPMILFPCAITNAIATLLLPTVTEYHSTQKKKELQSIIQKVELLCLSLGMIAMVFFLTTGSILGTLLFSSSLAGRFIRVLCFLCPFIYLNTTISSILHGFGKVWSSFLIQILSLTIRIASVLVFIPRFGILSYLYGLILSQITITILSNIVISKSLKVF